MYENEAIRAYFKWLATVIATVILLFCTAALFQLPGCKDGRCTDYVTFVSAAPGSPSTASCKPGMTMETKDKWQGVRVTCTCPKDAR